MQWQTREEGKDAEVWFDEFRQQFVFYLSVDDTEYTLPLSDAVKLFRETGFTLTRRKK